jgi:hypothetical protein
MNINTNIEGYIQTGVAPWGTSSGYRNACAKVCIDQAGTLLELGHDFGYILGTHCTVLEHS